MSDKMTENLNIYIPPWCLPNETIPIHVVWHEDFDFTYVKIDIPEGFHVNEIVNINKYVQESNCIRFEKKDIKYIKKITNFPNFFGILLFWNNIQFPNLFLFKDINISFLNLNNEELKSFCLTAKIFRPKLINVTELAQITLKDEKDIYNLSLDLEYHGFGIVKTFTEINVNEVNFNPVELMYEEICRKMAELIRMDNSVMSKSIKDDEITKFIQQIEEYEKQTDEKKRSLIDFMEKSKPNLTLVIFFILSIINLLNIRLQSYNVALDNPIINVPKKSFHEEIINIEVIIHYKDLVENQYEPLIIKIPIQDKRTKIKDSKIDFSIRISPIIDKSLPNVEKMKVKCNDEKE